MSIEKRDVLFKSGETFAAAWFFLPNQARSGRRVPAVAMAHGFGAVKEMYLEPFARRFAAAGIAALVFDYRGFGASGGEPRQRGTGCPLGLCVEQVCDAAMTMACKCQRAAMRKRE
jgi:fermentation-respiration switch protein FrsA (DUF1100 family)